MITLTIEIEELGPREVRVHLSSAQTIISPQERKMVDRLVTAIDSTVCNLLKEGKAENIERKDSSTFKPFGNG